MYVYINICTYTPYLLFIERDTHTHNAVCINTYVTKPTVWQYEL